MGLPTHIPSNTKIIDLNRYLVRFLSLSLCLLLSDLHSSEREIKDYVSAHIFGQLGNNMFQVATACALAWDHNALAVFPDLATKRGENNPLNYEHVFFRCRAIPIPQDLPEWKEPSFAYHPIPYSQGLALDGYFQSEKYFVHHRQRLLNLFAPCSEDQSYMQRKYQWLMDHSCTVGVQLRDYLPDDRTGNIHIQYGKDYLDKAMRLFPDTALFIVSSNNMEFARQNIPEWVKNVVFIDDEPNYINLYLLSFCKHNIITNSSFGWWAAWLNQNPDKIIITPSLWVNPAGNLPTQDLWPDGWIKLDAKWGGACNPQSYQ